MTAVETPADPLWSASARALDLTRAVLGAREAPVGSTPKTVIWRKNKARLYRYDRATPPTHRTPLFIVLPLINRSYILDLRPGASLVEYLVDEGFDVFLLDWGIPGDEDRALNLDDLLARYLPRATRHASQAAGGGPLSLLGYCIGGTLATCYTALFGESPVPVKNLVLFTTPIDFTEAGKFGEWTARQVFPLELLTNVFPVVPGQIPDLGSKLLNPLPTTVGTYVRLWDRLGDTDFDLPGWQALYRWVNEGVPFPSAAYRQWISDFYQSNKLARGELRVDGQPVRLEAIRCPVLNVAASADAIAPRTTTGAILNLVSSQDTQELILSGGHVGTIVGRAARTQLWPRVTDWLAQRD
jgi:polyhydroxyalkanoate synthase subunit PhaC